MVEYSVIGAFTARGYWGTTTTEAAKAAGISRAYAYRTREDDGYLLTVVSDLKQDASQLLDPRPRPRHLRRLTARGSWGDPPGARPRPCDGSASARTFRQACVYLA